MKHWMKYIKPTMQPIWQLQSYLKCRSPQFIFNLCTHWHPMQLARRIQNAYVAHKFD